MPPYEPNVDCIDLYECYKKSPYLSIKHSSYFQVYADLLQQFRGKEITFVEVGVLNGGSLFMWREYFGSKARIIGIDFNPGAKRWEKEGFEIFTGSQADTEFWRSFFESIGPVDVVLDDGGHTFEQQIVTTHSCIPHIKDGGLMIVEDTHTSYFEEFGYPTKYSFIEWTKKIIDNINSRFPRVKVSTLPYKERIYSITVFESIVCFKIHRDKCFESSETTNGGIRFKETIDFRYKDSSVASFRKGIASIANQFSFLRKIQVLRRMKNAILVRHSSYVDRRNAKRLRNLF